MGKTKPFALIGAAALSISSFFIGALGAPSVAAASTSSTRTGSGSPTAAAVRSCPSFSPVALRSAVGVAAVNVAGCPGYWVANSSGQVDSYGSAAYHGALDSPTAHIVGITATADGKGYWLIGANGAVYGFGDAPSYGGASHLRLRGPILGMSVTQDGRGYWLVASDGGIFSYGDARFHGSMGGKHLNQPVDGMAVAPGGGGYWLVASDGGVFTFSSDGFYGAMGGRHLNRPVMGMSGTPDGRGYTLLASDGGVFNFGDSPFYGSLGSHPTSSPIVDLAPAPANDGYYLLDGAGHVFGFGPGARVPATLTMHVPATPMGEIGSGYRATFSASGGAVPYHWTASGSPPPGIHLSPSGVLSGTPSKAGAYSFDVTVADSANPAQTSTASITVQVNPKPTSSVHITTTGLPAADMYQSYRAPLAATGGAAPYMWTLVGGALPTGVTVAGGTLTGVPTQLGAFDFTVQARDAAGRTTTASLSLLVTTPTTWSSNWSGYAISGGPFTAVTGTFTVPHLAAAAQADEDMAEWVGIDGAYNGNLIQAGVDLEPDPNTPEGDYVQPWWEILPAYETPVSTMTVATGDSVTVTIGRVAATTTWKITIVDNTNGQSFTTNQTYTGPADSAEWIVEAPTVNGIQTSIAPYSPSALFSKLETSQGARTAIERIVLIDPYTNRSTSTPSALDSTGFKVAYGATAPPAP